MTSQRAPSIHASAVNVGAHGLLIRGPSGSGKSKLCMELLIAGSSGQIPPASLVGDDRIHLAAINGELIASPAPELAGLIEIRGLGIRRVPHVPQAVIQTVIDLDAECDRMPVPDALRTEVIGISVQRIAISSRMDAKFTVLAALLSQPQR